jgi:hypothetical protein
LSDENNPRPKWSRTDISEDDARWLRDHSVKRIDSKWAMTGVDTADYWLDLHADGAKKPYRLNTLPDCVRFTPNYSRGMLALSDYVVRDVDAIDQWEKRHKKDVSEFKRLQKKLYGVA